MSTRLRACVCVNWRRKTDGGGDGWCKKCNPPPPRRCKKWLIGLSSGWWSVFLNCRRVIINIWKKKAVRILSSQVSHSVLLPYRPLACRTVYNVHRSLLLLLCTYDPPRRRRHPPPAAFLVVSYDFLSCVFQTGNRAAVTR